MSSSDPFLPTQVKSAHAAGTQPAPRETLDEKRRQMLADAEKLAGIGSFEWDIPENKITWSDGLYAIYGLEPGEFAASLEAFLGQVHPDDRDTVKTTIERAYRDGQPFSMEERVIRPDGSVRTLRSKGEVIVGADGVAERLIGVCQDITEAKQSEQLVADWNRTLEQQVQERTAELGQANAKLEQALDQLKAMQHHIVIQAKMATVGNLVAGIAHEVNSPVGAAKGANDVIERCVSRISDALESAVSVEELRNSAELRKLLRTLRESARTATSAGNRLTEIVERLKFLSQLDEAPRGKLHLHEALDGVLAVTRHQTSDRIEVTRDYGALPEIWCDVGQLNQAFMSLLLNASQAIDGKGEIRIATWTESGDVFVRIQDNGRGIPDEKLERLFDIGFNARSSKVRLGTGLFNAYNIVRNHGGDITVESEPGRGAAFVVRLPVRV